VAIAASSSIPYVAAYLGAVRAGATVTPLQPSATPDQLVAMLEDARPTHLFLDEAVARALAAARRPVTTAQVALDGSSAGRPFADWLAPAGARPAPVALAPGAPFNVIYSSGTTGSPK